MSEFPVIDRIRKVRKEISEEHGHETERLVKHYKELEKKTRRKFFRREMKEDKVA